MRYFLDRYFPKAILGLADNISQYLPTSLKLKYHNLGKEPILEFLIPATHKEKIGGFRFPSQSYYQCCTRMDMTKAFSNLKANIEYHLKLDHNCIIMVSYLDSEQVNQLNDLAISLRKQSLAISADEVKSVFSTKEFTKSFFKKNGLLIITNTDFFTQEQVTDFKLFNSQLKYELRFGKRTIQYILDDSVCGNQNLYYDYDYSLYLENQLVNPKIQKRLVIG